MKLKKLINMFDSLGRIRIYSNEEEDPIYEGSILDIPWWIVEQPIAKEVNGDEPIHTWFSHDNTTGRTEGLLIVNIEMK